MFKDPVSRYKIFLYLELAVVVAVMMIFRFIKDPEMRPVAGLIAGSVFFISTVLVLILEWRFARAWTTTMIGGLVFLIASVIPILLLRMMSWGVPFDEASLFGLPGAFLHKSSNIVFLLFLVGIFLSLQRARNRA